MPSRSLDSMPGIDMLNPCGKLSFDNLDPDDNEDDDTEVVLSSTVPSTPLSTELKDAAEEELDNSGSGSQLRTPVTVSHSITVGGQSMRKARALSQRLKYGSPKVSTDRNRRVAGFARHSDTSATGSAIVEFDSVFGDPCLMISDVIATLVQCDGRIFLCFGESRPRRSTRENSPVSSQFLKIIPATTNDDGSSQHDWKSAGVLDQTLKVLGQMIQPLDPTLSRAQIGRSHYLFESSALRILAASLFEQLTPQKRLLVPAVTSSKFFPYREGGGRACFVCEFDNNSLQFATANTCSACPPNTPLDPKQGQQVLAHNAAHILYDPNINRATNPCGSCLNPAPMCEYYLTTTGKQKINTARAKCPNLTMTFRYSTAEISTESSPSSNVPIRCTLCAVGQPDIWRYSFENHLRTVHPSAPLDKYSSIWKLHPDELKRIRKVWETRAKGVPIPKKRSPVTTSYVISEAHSSRLSMRSTVDSATVADNSELPTIAEDSDEESAKETGDDSEDDEDDVIEPSNLADLEPSISGATMDLTEAMDDVPHTVQLEGDADDDMPDPNTLSARAAPSNTNITAVDIPPIEFGRGKRKRKARDIGNLSQCLCGDSVSRSSDDAIQCNRNGCETG
ncbi:hypothetical protein DFH09DRAFT_1436126 [Mycena vulgaris]|nr:hypothetical protein DFH09DRAFT_1436126 [Mycena vulgaris]